MPLAFLAANVFDLPVIWIWLVILDHIARAVWLVWSFVRGTWRKRGSRSPWS